MLIDIAKRHFMFSDDIKFLQKVIIMHPIDQTKFLTLKRSPSDNSRPNCWDLCGGNVMWSELHNESLIREVKEESGLEMVNLKPIQILTSFEEEKKVYYLFIGYIAQSVSDHVILSSEHTEYKWVTKEEFLTLVSAPFLVNLIKLLP